MSWTLVTALIVGTYVLRAAGLVAMAWIDVPRIVMDVVSWAPAALIAGVVAFGTVGDPAGVVFDARAVGVAAGLVAVLLRAPFVIVFGVTVGITALVRAMA